MKIFWSWQSDRDPKLHHYFVRDALKEACKLIAVEANYTEAARPEVDHDTKNVTGTPDIARTILDKIESANVFVADMTPVGMTNPSALQSNTPLEKRSEPKYLQNPNVMSELGYAEKALTQSRIVLVANAAHYPGPIALPFDWRHRSGAKVYRLADGATKAEVDAERRRFAQVLKSCIKPILVQDTPTPTPPPAIVWQRSSDTDPTLWQGADSGLTYKNASLSEPRRQVRLQPGTRIFARMSPSYWQTPARIELEQRISNAGFEIRGRDGDWGLNADGALSIWGRVPERAQEMIVTSATQWFQQNGELWGVNTSCFAEHAGERPFAYRLPFGPLNSFLRRGVATIKTMGGSGPIGVKLGAGDLMGTVWPGEYRHEKHEVLQPWADVSGVSEEWTVDERLQLLLKFWNALADAYGQPLARTVDEFQQAASVPPE